ncbi:unnamed protein product [Toxocara canis]|uniref:CTNNB1_binding domain-containing protein n=1 Tax=Toxocara canis TaxID=6265 RepID=A0A183VHB7_TOXCA|nr:unnamed protein product [Toxocara canis]
MASVLEALGDNSDLESEEGEFSPKSPEDREESVKQNDVNRESAQHSTDAAEKNEIERSL